MCSVLQHKMDELKEGLRQRDELIEVRTCAVEILNCEKNALTGMRAYVLEGRELKNHKQFTCLFTFSRPLKFYKREM